LAPIRTAGYALLTDTQQAGFWRITGAQSEASSFGAVSLMCLAFTYTYWRKTGSRSAFILSVLLFVLICLSTSSTAYAGLMVLGAPVMLSILYSLISGRLVSAQALVIVLATLGMAGGMYLYIVHPSFFDPIVHLIDATLVNKLESASAHERAYWNYKSLQSFFDTGGLGVGLGSSRASSWLIAVLSQLGVLGSLLILALVAIIARPPLDARLAGGREVDAIVSSVRMCAIAVFVSRSISGAAADPGMIVFVSLAVVSAYNVRYRSSHGSPSSDLREAEVSSLGAVGSRSA
jgi:hypothetical protein